jgi:hypothetical protein
MNNNFIGFYTCVDFRKDYGISSTIWEIDKRLGLRSPASVQRYIDSLTDMGMLLPANGRQRVIVPALEMLRMEKAQKPGSIKVYVPGTNYHRKEQIQGSDLFRTSNYEHPKLWIPDCSKRLNYDKI